jgi:histidinol-phosphate aminotransferase
VTVLASDPQGARRSFDPASAVRPELRALPRYALDLAPCRFKLDQNEVPWDLPRRLKSEICRRLLERDWARYPDFHAEALRREIGRLHDWPADGVLVGNGSNELLGVALEALAGPRREVLGVEPSFGLYPALVARSGARYRAVPSGGDLALPLAALAEEVERDATRPLLLCTPNNPTGSFARIGALRALLRSLDAPLLLDNAYGEFCDEDYRPLLREFRQVVLFRTLSKAWSLAGLRLGYLLADPALVEQLLKVKLPYNLGLGAAIAGEVVLRERAVAARRVRVLRGRRAQLARLLGAAGLEVFPSAANFVLARAGGADPWTAARRLRAGLEARGLRVRDVGSAPGLAGCLRFSVGDGRAMRALAAALSEIVGSGGASR